MTTTIYDLDGIYVRVERDGKWQSLCVSDLTPEELKSVTEDWDYNMYYTLKLMIESLKSIQIFRGWIFHPLFFFCIDNP